MSYVTTPTLDAAVLAEIATIRTASDACTPEALSKALDVSLQEIHDSLRRLDIADEVTWNAVEGSITVVPDP